MGGVNISDGNEEEKLGTSTPGDESETGYVSNSWESDEPPTQSEIVSLVRRYYDLKTAYEQASGSAKSIAKRKYLAARDSLEAAGINPAQIKKNAPWETQSNKQKSTDRKILVERRAVSPSDEHLGQMDHEAALRAGLEPIITPPPQDIAEIQVDSRMGLKIVLTDKPSELDKHIHIDEEKTDRLRAVAHDMQKVRRMFIQNLAVDEMEKLRGMTDEDPGVLEAVADMQFLRGLKEEEKLTPLDYKRLSLREVCEKLLDLNPKSNAPDSLYSLNFNNVATFLIMWRPNFEAYLTDRFVANLVRQLRHGLHPQKLHDILESRGKSAKEVIDSSSKREDAMRMDPKGENPWDYIGGMKPFKVPGDAKADVHGVKKIRKNLPHPKKRRK